MLLGYTTGVFDFFHVGHVEILKRAKSLCDKLIVGVSTDELVLEYKNKKPFFSFYERCSIVESVKYVDIVVPQKSMNKFEMWERLKFDLMFVGDDWYSTEKWKKFEEQFNQVGVKIIYLPYTEGISSTLIREKITKFKEGQK